VYLGRDRCERKREGRGGKEIRRDRLSYNNPGKSPKNLAG